VTEVSEKLSKTKDVLADIEKQKDEATRMYEKEKQKEAELKAELEKELSKSGGAGGKKSQRVLALERQIREMSEDFVQKDSQMKVWRFGCVGSRV
jgi:type II secretory pathway component GspD/PulD (secretin)